MAANMKNMLLRHTKHIWRNDMLIFQVSRCGLFTKKQYPFLQATPDFLTSWDCCGLGCGEIKCPICIQDGDFDKYVQEKSSSLEKSMVPLC